MFKWLEDLLKKILVAVLVVLVIVLIFSGPLSVAFAGFAWPAALSFMPGLLAFGAALGPLGAIMLGLGIAYLVDPDGTSEFIAGVAEDVGEVGASFISAVATGLFGGSPATILAVGLGVYVGYKYLTREKKDEPQRIEESESGEEQTRIIPA